MRNSMKIKVNWTEVKTVVTDRVIEIDPSEYENLSNLTFKQIKKTAEDDLLFVGEEHLEAFMKSHDSKGEQKSVVIYSDVRVKETPDDKHK